MSSESKSAMRARRLELDLKPIELAVRAACSVPTIYNLESGRCSPTLRMAQRIAKALDTTVDALFPEANQPGAAA